MAKHLQLVLVAFLLVGCASKKKSAVTWKNNAKAAICLTYDDGMQTHLDVAIPQLDTYGFRGTFFLNTVGGRENIIRWKAAARKGHELGNHSLFHPCPKSFGWQDELATDNYSVKQLLNEIKAVNQILVNLDHDRKSMTYAYPCNNTKVGDTSYILPLKQSKLIKYARGGGEEPLVITDFSKVDTMHMYSWAVPEGTEVEELIAFAEEAKKHGGLAIFQFHGVGDQWIKVSKDTHEGLLKYLSEHSSEFWVASFETVMDHIAHK